MFSSNKYGYAIAVQFSDDWVAQSVTAKVKIDDILGLSKEAAVRNIPHVTLYHCVISDTDLLGAQFMLMNIVNQYSGKPPCIKFLGANNGGIVVTGDNRWIDQNIERYTKDGQQTKGYGFLIDLQKKIVDEFSVFRAYTVGNSINKIWGDKEILPRMKDIYHNLSLSQQQQVDEFGVSGIGEDGKYTPHRTFEHTGVWPMQVIEHNRQLVEVEVWQKEFDLTEAANAVAEMFPHDSIEYPVNVIFGELGFNGNIIKPLLRFNFNFDDVDYDN